MDRDALHQTADDGCVQPLGGRCAANDRVSARRIARGAWLIRAATVVYFIANGIVAYLVFSTA
jgi:hypothetical protein